MAAMESLRRVLHPFPALVASTPAPSKVDRQQWEVAAALAALLSPEEADEMLPEEQAAQEDAVHLLLDTFFRAHAEDHMSDRMKLGSWRLPYVAMVHSYASLHLPLMRQLETLLHSSSGASLVPVQCSALSTFMLFMNPYQILNDPDDRPVDNSPSQELGSGMKHKEVGGSHVKALFEWRWEACFRAQSGALDMKEQESMKSRFTGSAEAGNHWMDRFWDALPMDNETNILWAARFAASYLRNVAVYWEHIFFNKDDCREAWLLTDLALQLKHITLVSPIFVAFVPQSMVVFLMWLQQRLDFAFHFDQSLEIAGLRKALALCEAVLASPLGVLLRSTKLSLSLTKFFEMELRTGWKEWILSKSRHPFLRYVVWGGAITGGREYFSWGLLWKDFGGDKTRVCVALTTVLLTSQCQRRVESRFKEGELLGTGSCQDDGDGVPKSSWSGTKKQCVRAETPDPHNLPQFLWLEESEANPAEVCILQIIIELSSKLDPQCGPWLLEVAFDCLNNQARLENAIFTHCEACAYEHNCKSRHYSSGICSAYRLKSCIVALPPSHSISYERLYKMEKVFMFCWLGDGPFSIDFAGQLLSSFHISKTAAMFPKAENKWSTLLLATCVRFFNVVGPPVLDLHYRVGDTDLGSVLAHLHTTQQFLTSNSINTCLDIDGFKVAATAMPQLAAVTLIEALFTASSCTSFALREGFLAKLATTEASQQQHVVSSRAVDILRKITGLQEDQRFFLQSLLFTLVDLSSMASISSTDLIIKKWTAFEYKRKWVHEHKSSLIPRELQGRNQGKPHTVIDGGSFRNMDENSNVGQNPRSLERSKHISLASLELELDERLGKPQMTTWDILLEWAVTSISLYPDCISQLLISTKSEGVTIATGSKLLLKVVHALTLSLVVAALPRNTAMAFAQSDATKASWTLLLSQMRMGLENGFHQLLLMNQKPETCDFSATKAEMDLYLLQLQGILQSTTL